MTKVMTPVEWYADLSRALLNVQAKLLDRDAGFETGLDKAKRFIIDTGKCDATVWWVGNGGSAAICSHLAQDVMNKLDIKSFFLGDSSLMTCMANDFGYENVYAKPLEKLAGKDDLLIAISSSGNSPNIINCVDTIRQKGGRVVSLSGFDKSNLLWNKNSDVSFFVSSDLYGIVEMAHEAILHGLIETRWLEMTVD